MTRCTCKEGKEGVAFELKRGRLMWKWNVDVKRDRQTQLQLRYWEAKWECGFRFGGVKKESRPGSGWNEGERTEKRSMQCTML
jgi:hypothetical protein